jgi:hypothetical protein
MTVKYMTEIIAKVEKARDVFIYLSYDDNAWKFTMYKESKMLSRAIPPNQMAVWNIDILERFLNRMADDIEIGVIC